MNIYLYNENVKEIILSPNILLAIYVCIGCFMKKVSLLLFLTIVYELLTDSFTLSYPHACF